MILPLYFFLSRIVFRPTITTPKPSTCACVTPVLAFAPVPAPPVSRQTQVQARKHRGAGSKSISQVRCQKSDYLSSALCPLWLQIKEKTMANDWLRSQNAVELRLPVLHSSPATEGGWKGRNVFLKVLNGNAETHASPCSCFAASCFAAKPRFAE